MALVPPWFLDCVVALGVKEGDKDTRWVASGFFLADLAKAEPDGNIYHVALVTNRHVVTGKPRLRVRANPAMASPAKEFDLDLVGGDGKERWLGHPDVDVAVVPVNFQVLVDHGIKVAAFFSDQHVADRAKAVEVGLTEGDGVFSLGFPLGLVGEERNFVIVRQGCIARIRDALAGTSKEFLADLSIFPGNSGGPVVSIPSATAITGTKHQDRAYLLGVVQGYLSYRDMAISAQTQQIRVIFEENSGLARVVPIDFALETLRTHVKAVGAGDAVIPINIGEAPPPANPAADPT